MQDTPETAEFAKRAEEASQRARKMKTELRKKRRADKLKLQQQLGAELMKETNIVSAQQLKQYLQDNLNYEAEAENQQDYQQALIELNTFANQLTWDEERGYWRVANLRTLTDWLAGFRTNN
uniref:Uncharacterized protein n=1 Tax=Lactiplantibacillus plantarum TaxID=1590 RepID=A0A1B3IR22_LACPN|nr:hypothetical protein [Lactiplantibacillus plantarum]AOF43526.1 hypothetical protein [Lactiplantibacillus plantarum]